MNDDKNYTYLAKVTWGGPRGGSLKHLVGDDLRELARAAIRYFPFPPRIYAEMTALVFAELDKDLPTIDYTNPFSVPFGGMDCRFEIAFDAPVVIGDVGKLA